MYLEDYLTIAIRLCNACLHLSHFDFKIFLNGATDSSHLHIMNYNYTFWCLFACIYENISKYRKLYENIVSTMVVV